MEEPEVPIMEQIVQAQAPIMIELGACLGNLTEYDISENKPIQFSYVPTIKFPKVEAYKYKMIEE